MVAFTQNGKIEVISSFIECMIFTLSGFSFVLIGSISFYFVWQAVKRDQHTLPKAKDESQCPAQSGEFVTFGMYVPVTFVFLTCVCTFFSGFCVRINSAFCIMSVCKTRCVLILLHVCNTC